MSTEAPVPSLPCTNARRSRVCVSPPPASRPVVRAPSVVSHPSLTRPLAPRLSSLRQSSRTESSRVESPRVGVVARTHLVRPVYHGVAPIAQEHLCARRVKTITIPPRRQSLHPRVRSLARREATVRDHSLIHPSQRARAKKMPAFNLSPSRARPSTRATRRTVRLTKNRRIPRATHRARRHRASRPVASSARRAMMSACGFVTITTSRENPLFVCTRSATDVTVYDSDRYKAPEFGTPNMPRA